MISHLELRADSEDSLNRIAGLLSQQTPAGSLLTLRGDLGAGKTSFARGFLRARGYQGIVKSPTYNLVEIYDELHPKIYHFDLYRIRDPEELELIGLEEYFDKTAICLMEWPERALNLPVAYMDICITHKGEGRHLRIVSLQSLECVELLPWMDQDLQN